jgi:hypothetical protein
VILPDGRNLNHELVKRGYAWWYRKYASHDRIWSGWRKRHGRLSAGYGAILMRSRLGSIGSVKSQGLSLFFYIEVISPKRFFGSSFFLIYSN